MAISAFGLVRSQHEKRPFWQNQHWPQLIVNGDNGAIADLEISHLGAELDHLTHILMAHDVAALHRRLISVEEMEIRAADRTGGDLDDRVTLAAFSVATRERNI
jgi:hypothetical protein